MSALLSSSQNQAAGMMSGKVNVQRHRKATNLLDWDILLPSINMLGYVYSSLGVHMSCGLLVGYACISSDPHWCLVWLLTPRASIVGSAISPGCKESK